MSQNAARDLRFLSIARRHGAGPSRIVAVVLLAAITSAFLLGCVTQLARPAQTLSATPTVAVTETPPSTHTPTVAPTATSVPPPVPTATRVPTATPIPTSTAEPGPSNPTATPGPTPVPTEDFGTLVLQIYAPDEGATIPVSAVAVYGQTTPGARIFIAGEEAEVDAVGGFRADVSLAPAENEIVVTAVAEDGQRRSLTRTVTSLALPFLLLITEPENESIVSDSTLPLAGRTGPNAIVSINGRSVPVDRFGYFAGLVQLDDGPNVIDVVATNEDGRTLSTVLAVIYRVAGE